MKQNASKEIYISQSQSQQPSPQLSPSWQSDQYNLNSNYSAEITMPTMDDIDNRTSPKILGFYALSMSISILVSIACTVIIFLYTGFLEIIGTINQIFEKLVSNKGINRTTIPSMSNSPLALALKSALDFIGHPVIKRYMRIGIALTFGAVAGASVNSYIPLALSSVTCLSVILTSLRDYKNYLKTLDSINFLDKTGKLRSEVSKLDKLIAGLNIHEETIDILKSYIESSEGIRTTNKIKPNLCDKYIPNYYLRNLPYTLWSNILECSGVILINDPFAISLSFIGLSSENKFRTDYKILRNRIANTIESDLEYSGLKGRKFTLLSNLDIAIDKQIYFYEKLLQEKEYFEHASKTESAEFAKILIANTEIKYKNNEKRIALELKEEWKGKTLLKKIQSKFTPKNKLNNSNSTQALKYIHIWDYASRIYDIERLNKQIRASRFKLCHDFSPVN